MNPMSVPRQRNVATAAAAAATASAFNVGHQQDTPTAITSTTQPPPPLFDRIISSSFGALLTSLVVTPLEVVKVRLQTQSHVPFPTSVATAATWTTSPAACDLILQQATTPNTCEQCTHVIFDDGLMDRHFPKHELAYRCKNHVRFTGPTHAFLWIIRNEGVGSLYNGLNATLLMSIPATVLYFSAYDELKATTNWGPSISGAVARILAVTCVAPFELLRTRQQSQTNPQGMIGLYKTEMSAAAIREAAATSTKTRSPILVPQAPQFPWFLWRGLSPTLWRDVPFSAIYWAIVETVKSSLTPLLPPLQQQQHNSNGETSHLTPPPPLAVTFVAACTGGAVAGIITHPFDVVKTRRQVFEFARDHVPTSEETSTWRIIQRILNKDGWRGLFIGLAPRVMKIVPSTAIMLTSYDFGKQWFGVRRQD